MIFFSENNQLNLISIYNKSIQITRQNKTYTNKKDPAHCYTMAQVNLVLLLFLPPPSPTYVARFLFIILLFFSHSVCLRSFLDKRCFFLFTAQLGQLLVFSVSHEVYIKLIVSIKLLLQCPAATAPYFLSIFFTFNAHLIVSVWFGFDASTYTLDDM